MYANEDIYTGTSDPSTNINPKIIGAFYINTKTAKLFVCTDNTINNNTWKMCNPDIKIPEFKPDGLGYNQSYQELINKHNIWFTNTSDKPIFVVAFPKMNRNNSYHYIDVKDLSDVITSIGFNQNDPYDHFLISCVIPPYFSYMLNTNIKNTYMWVLS